MVLRLLAIADPSVDLSIPANLFYVEVAFRLYHRIRLILIRRRVRPIRSEVLQKIERNREARARREHSD